MRALLSRFRDATRGLLHLLLRDASGRLHSVCAVAVVIMGMWLRVPAMEWAVLSLAMGAVLAAEALNSAIEKLADRVTLEREETIRLLKDLSAGGVLAASLGAAAVALFLFGPRLLALV